MKQFNEGEEVILDKDFANSSVVTVVCQSPQKLFTLVMADLIQWEVMTYRLSAIKETLNG